MRTDQIVLKSSGLGMSDALAITEQLGSESGLDRKQTLHLRLLAEELIGMLRGVAGDVEALYWLERDGKNFELHMKSDIMLTPEMREQLISVSSGGENYAAKGFMGRIRVMIADVLLSAGDALPVAMAETISAYPSGDVAGEIASVWSMAIYRNEVRKQTEKSSEAANAWDELEKSIVANIADDVKVRIVGRKVEIAVYKSF